jgi:hypothetical protein
MVADAGFSRSYSREHLLAHFIRVNHAYRLPAVPQRITSPPANAPDARIPTAQPSQ